MPTALLLGTFFFFSMTCVGNVLGCGLYGCRVMSKDTMHNYVVSVTLAGICMWMMWICTWLHQWHPIVEPLIKTE
jgi:V-type H+-transporting ATPase subunit e